MDLILGPGVMHQGRMFFSVRVGNISWENLRRSGALLIGKTCVDFSGFVEQAPQSHWKKAARVAAAGFVQKIIFCAMDFPVCNIFTRRHYEKKILIAKRVYNSLLSLQLQRLANGSRIAYLYCVPVRNGRRNTVPVGQLGPGRHSGDPESSVLGARHAQEQTVRFGHNLSRGSGETMNETRKNRQHGFSMIELLIVTLIALVIAAMAVPGFQSIQRYLRIAGDCRNLFSITAQAKMQAASQFTHARARVGLASNMYYIEVWDKASNQWLLVGGRQTLSQGVTPGFATVANPPLNTQATLAQAALCRSTGPMVTPAATLPNDVCIEFNSRGIPVDTTETPAGNGAFYVTDGNSVYGVTVSVSGLIQSWYINQSDTNWQRR